MIEIAPSLRTIWSDHHENAPNPTLGFDHASRLIFKNKAILQSADLKELYTNDAAQLGRAVLDELRDLVGRCLLSKSTEVHELQIDQRTCTLVLQHYSNVSQESLITVSVTGSKHVSDAEKNHPEQRLTELRQINHRVDSFLRATSHDLRLPVTNLRNYSRLLARTNDERSRKELTKRIENSAEQLEELLDGMMDIAESRNTADEHGETINLRSVVDDVLHVLEDQLREAGAAVRISLDDCVFAYHKAYARSIVFNLLSNAIKYRSAERALEITIAGKASTNGVWLSISDNGLGMNLVQEKDKLFKPFKRLTNVGEGKGVGLSLVKTFVESNHGELKVESEPNVGTTFRLFLRSYEPEVKQFGLFD